MKQIEQYFTKVKFSERQEETNTIFDIKLNDKQLNLRTCEYFYITSDYDVRTDLKLQSKSLILKYLESHMLLQNVSSEIETVNILLQSISDALVNDQIPLIPNILPLSEKSILKLLSPYLIIDDLLSNEYDFNYEEKICFQLNMIKTISENNLFNSGLIILNLPKVTSKILESLNQIKNCHSIIFTNSLSQIDDMEMIIYLSNKINVDFSNSEEVHEKIINNLDVYLTYEEVIQEMKNIILKKRTNKTDFIQKLL